jgi:WD40 repeat protein
LSAVERQLDSTGHLSPIVHVAFRADGRRLASCSYDGRVLVWERTGRTSFSRLTSLRHRRRVYATAWNPAAADLLATASTDRTAAVWRIVADRPPQLLTLLDHQGDDVHTVMWTPGGQGLLCLTGDGDVVLWDAMSATFVHRVGRRRARCVMAAVSVTGSVATVSEDDVVVVGDLSPRRPRAIRRYAGPVGACAWSPSGSALAVSRGDGVLELLTPGLDLLRTFAVPARAVRSIAWGGDDHLVVGGCDGSLHLVDRGGSPLWQLRDATMWPTSMSVAMGLVAVGSLRGAPHVIGLATDEPSKAGSPPG